MLVYVHKILYKDLLLVSQFSENNYGSFYLLKLYFVLYLIIFVP